MRRCVWKTFVVLSCGVILLISVIPSLLCASGSGPTRQQVKVYDRDHGQCFLGPGYQLRLVYSYNGDTFLDRTYNHGETFAEAVSPKEYERGGTFACQAYLYDKASGNCIGKDSFSAKVDFDGSYGTAWYVSINYYADPPYFTQHCIQAKDLYGYWTFGFAGEQRTKW